MHHAPLACDGMAATTKGNFLDLFADVGVCSSDLDRRVFYASNISFFRRRLYGAILFGDDIYCCGRCNVIPDW